MKIRARMFICILGLLAVSLWSTSAFAQSALSVSSVPRTTAISTGHTEIAGDILVQAGPTGGLGAGSATLTVDYKVPITVPGTGNAYITICGAGTLATTGGAACPEGQYLYSTSGAVGTYQIGGTGQNQLLIVLPPTAANTATGGTITISGVKVSLAAYTGTVLAAGLSVSAPTGFGAYSIGAGQNATDVISLIAPAFTTAVMTGGSGTPLAGVGTGQILTTTSVSDRIFNIDIPETFVDAFKTTLGSNSYLNDASLTFTFSGIPNGVFLNLVGGGSSTNATCTAATGTLSSEWPIFYTNIGGTTTQIPAVNFTNPIISNSTNTTVLNFTGLSFNLTQLETIRIRGCIYTNGATAPLTAGTIAAAITLSPNGSALGTTTPPQINPVAGNFPRYQTSLVNVNVATIVAAETDMLISFAARNTGGFDTGIAVANTSTDPFGTNGITPNDGTVTLNFYPQGTGSPFTYTTAAGAPGLGLSATGVLVSGKTWSVGLSELLGAITGAPTSFSGYIFVRANFTNAHGAAYVTDYRGFTSASPFLIVQLSRPSVNESLGQ
jgi:hypothetical protein